MHPKQYKKYAALELLKMNVYFTNKMWYWGTVFVN